VASPGRLLPSLSFTASGCACARAGSIFPSKAGPAAPFLAHSVVCWAAAAIDRVKRTTAATLVNPPRRDLGRLLGNAAHEGVGQDLP